METRLARFEVQVNAAQRSAPPSKTWVRQALKRQGTGRCPVRLKRLSLDVALRSGQLSGAGLDVFEVEPLAADSPLRSLPNAMLSSHAASVSERAVELLQTKAAQAVLDFLQGRRPASTLT